MRSKRQMRGYVLAGGRSSRMGRDKAEIVFDGQTMLATAVASMRAVCDDVAVVGQREQVPGGVVCVPDRYPGCGPMGGIEAALRDCGRAGAEFAVFLPVDTPLLPGGLLRALTELWGGSEVVRIAVAVADGRMQPLVSMMHVAIAETLEEALSRSDHRLQPTLHEAAEGLAREMKVPSETVFLKTDLRFGDHAVFTASGEQLAWSPTDTEWGRRMEWFANLNTEAELREALPSRIEGRLDEFRAAQQPKNDAGDEDIA